MGVALRGGHIAVAKQILYHTKVCTTIEQVGREAVAQARVDASGVGCDGRGCGAHRVATAARRARCRTGRRPVLASTTSRRMASQARSASTAGALSGTRRCLPPLPHTVMAPADEVDGVDVEPAQLADPNAAAVQHLEHRVVAASAPYRLVVGLRVVCLVEQRRHLAVFEHSWQPRRARRSAQRHRRVDLEIAALPKERVVAAKRRHLASDACAWRTDAS